MKITRNMRAIVETQLLGHAKSDRAIVSQIKLSRSRSADAKARRFDGQNPQQTYTSPSCALHKCLWQSNEGGIFEKNASAVYGRSRFPLKSLGGNGAIAYHNERKNRVFGDCGRLYCISKHPLVKRPLLYWG